MLGEGVHQISFSCANPTWTKHVDQSKSTLKRIYMRISTTIFLGKLSLNIPKIKNTLLVLTKLKFSHQHLITPVSSMKLLKSKNILIILIGKTITNSSNNSIPLSINWIIKPILSFLSFSRPLPPWLFLYFLVSSLIFPQISFILSFLFFLQYLPLWDLSLSLSLSLSYLSHHP